MTTPKDEFALTMVLNLEGNADAVDQLWAFVSIDEQGREGICSALLNGTHYPMVSSKPHIVKKMKTAAKHISKATGKPVKLLLFSKREEIETITGLN